MKRFLIVLILIIITPTVCFAAEDDNYNEYLNSFDLSAFDELDDDTYSFLDDLGIADFNYDKLMHLSLKDILKHIWQVVVNSADAPVKAGLIVICFIILTSFFKSMSSELNSSELASTFSTVTSLAISIFLIVRITGCISLCCSTVKLCSNFSFAFFPAFCVIIATSGGGTTSMSVNTMLLALAQGLNYLSQMIFIPVTNCFLALGICSGIRQELNISSVVDTLKNLITKSISTISAIFVTILSLKTAVASRTDALGLRSMRFAINSVVPVIGSSISEGLLSIQSYSSLIKSSVGVVGIIAIAVIFLPALIEVNLWRIILSLSSICADVFGDKSSVGIIKTFSNTLLIIDVILILTMVTTIISIGILVAAKTVV